MRCVRPEHVKLVDGQRVVANLDGIPALNLGEPPAPARAALAGLALGARNQDRPGAGVEGRFKVGHPAPVEGLLESSNSARPRKWRIKNGPCGYCVARRQT